MIVIISFANFFYVINKNLYEESLGADTYIPDYTNDSVIIDTFLATYFICIGMYDVGRFGQGQDEYYIWVMFLLGTFINLIVFMNMLIAIMAKTFSDVMENEHLSSLSEKIDIINDHIWVIDSKKDEIFKNKKYLIKVSQINTEHNESYDIEDSYLETNFERKLDALHHTLNQKVLG